MPLITKIAIIITIIYTLVFFMLSIRRGFDIYKCIIALAVLIIFIVCIITYVDLGFKTMDTEIWSGEITSVEHNEEWDEWIPPRTETYTTTDSKGNIVTKTRIIDGYWEHHDASNYITTSDEGRKYVSKTPNGKSFTDSFVNSNSELEEYYPIGSPTASVHTYKNKVKTSYSLYKYQKVNLKQYPDLPDYPTEQNSDFTITRIIGSVPNNSESIKKLNELNLYLNDTNNPNNSEGQKSYKQCNLIFVNMGDVPYDYGYALEQYWQGGKKNDFVVAFGMKDNKVTWCNPFSWTEVESLKTEVKDYMVNLESVEDFVPVIKDVGHMVESDFVRKQFADFDYIQVELGAVAKILIILVEIIGFFIMLFI